MKNSKSPLLIISLILNVVFLSFGIYQYYQTATATKQLKEQEVIIQVMQELNEKSKQQAQEQKVIAQKHMELALEKVKTAEEANQ